VVRLAHRRPISGRLYYGEDPRRLKFRFKRGAQGFLGDADLWDMRVPRLISLLVTVTALALPAAAQAAGASVGPPVSVPATETQVPPGFSTSAREVKAIASRVPQMRAQQRRHPTAKLDVLIWGTEQWNVTLLGKGDRPLALVTLGADGTVRQVRTGLAAGGSFAEGNFDQTFRQPWLLALFGLLFLAPFVDPRRLRRLLHLDLLVLLSFCASYLLYEHGRPEAAVLLFYPPLAYLLARLLAAGLRPRARRGRLVPVLPTVALLVGVVALFGARVALNVADGKVIDVGYASVVGADRLAHKQELYTDNDIHGDTYGPINYLAYVPFELAFPWKGEWDGLPAAHAATLTFDLLTLVGLFLLGSQMRAGPEGRRLGLALAWAWAAFPFTLLGVMQNTNDGLVALLMVAALLALRSAGARGALLGLAAATKFFPGALLLLVARGRDGGDRRAWLRAGAACVGVFAFAFAMNVPAGGLRALWNCTLGFQLSRSPDFSLWAMDPGIGWTQTALQVLAVGIALLVAVLPRGRRSLAQVAALAGAIMIALELPAGHWFYFYIAWFAPFALVGLFGEHREPAAASGAKLEGDASASAHPPVIPLAA